MSEFILGIASKTAIHHIKGFIALIVYVHVYVSTSVLDMKDMRMRKREKGSKYELTFCGDQRWGGD